jgi:hypothetical protein
LDHLESEYAQTSSSLDPSCSCESGVVSSLLGCMRFNFNVPFHKSHDLRYTKLTKKLWHDTKEVRVVVESSFKQLNSTVVSVRWPFSVIFHGKGPGRSFAANDWNFVLLFYFFGWHNLELGLPMCYYRLQYERNRSVRKVWRCDSATNANENDSKNDPRPFPKCQRQTEFVFYVVPLYRLARFSHCNRRTAFSQGCQPWAFQHRFLPAQLPF